MRSDFKKILVQEFENEKDLPEMWKQECHTNLTLVQHGNLLNIHKI